MTIKGLDFGASSEAPAATLGFTAAEQTFMQRARPSHFLDAGSRGVIGSRMSLIDRVDGTVYQQIHTASPTANTAINGQPTLVFVGDSIFAPEETQEPINLSAWSMLFVASNLGAGVTSRVLIGPKPEASHSAGVGAPYVGLGSGTRLRVYDASGASRLDASGTYDYAGNERCAIVGFSTANGLAIQIDGNAAGTDAPDTAALSSGRFVLFAGTNASRQFTLPFYGEWAMTAIFPFNILHASYATELAAAEAYVAAKYGITFA
jgi:hypothetical protein